MNFSTTFKGICAAFIFSWLGLVALPWFQVGNLSPLKDPQDDKVIIPWDVPNAAHKGEKVYASEGCIYCHTQQVRDGSAGADFIRGWAAAPNNSPDDDAVKKEPIITRRSYPRDYIWRDRTFLGSSRTGADLTNVGGRFKDANAFYLELYDPYILSPNSAMPAYNYLFTTQKILSGKPSVDAVKDLPAQDAPPDGYEVVPTPQGKALVAYLLSLRNGYHLTEDEQQ